MSDPSDYIADDFHTLVAQVQENSVRDADKTREDEKLRALELRRESGAQGLTMSELVNEVYGEAPEKQRVKLEAEDARIQAEATAAAKAKEAPLVDSQNRFPAPTITTGS